MNEEISILFDAMDDLAYSLRVMTECAEEISGSNDLPERIVISYGASEDEIYSAMESAKTRYQNAKHKLYLAKDLLSEIKNSL